jgi:hypothetical protein
VAPSISDNKISALSNALLRGTLYGLPTEMLLCGSSKRVSFCEHDANSKMHAEKIRDFLFMVEFLV